MDTWDEEKIAAALTTQVLGRPVIYVPEIGSTNAYLQEQAAREAIPEGTLVIADYQTAGKGRLDRRWEAPAGSSLLFSLLFRPGWAAGRANWLTMMAGLAVVEAAGEATGLRMGLKWPNDVLCRVDGAWRKVGGVLLAASVQSEVIAQAVVGVGLNVNIPAEQMPETAMPATSLMIATGREVARLPLLAAILERLERIYRAADEGQSPHAAWNKWLVMTGEVVTVRWGDQALVGVMEGTAEDGQLMVRDQEGKVWTIPAGEVTLRA